MTEEMGFFPRPRGLYPSARIEDSYPIRVSYVQDERTGLDRWGRDRSTLLACGTGFGRGERICPAYLEESCPGDRNARTLGQPTNTGRNQNAKCKLDCGLCGGGGRAFTMAYCGWEKGQPMWDMAIAELGGSLRTDRISAPERPNVPPWPVSFIPSLEWAAKHWISVLGEKSGHGTYPVIATSYRTASPGKKRDGMDLRDRLGGYEGFLVVHGLAKDDVLDDWWDDREKLFKWNLGQDVDLVISPQFSYYDDDQLCMTVYNVNRSFRWYADCCEAGFKHVALDWPPGMPDWLHADYLEFQRANNVNVIAISYQTMNARGGMDPAHLRYLRILHAELPPHVSFLIFGVGNVLGMSQARAMLSGRNIVFLSSEPFARTAFWHLMTNEHAPKKWSKGEVFSWNALYVKKLADKTAVADHKRRARKALAEQRAAARRAA